MGWKGLQEIKPNPLETHIPYSRSKRTHRNTQEGVQRGLEYLQKKRLHNLYRQPVPVLHQPQSKKFLPHVQMELSVFQFVPLAPYPATGYHQKDPDPIHLRPSF